MAAPLRSVGAAKTVLVVTEGDLPIMVTAYRASSATTATLCRLGERLTGTPITALRPIIVVTTRRRPNRVAISLPIMPDGRPEKFSAAAMAVAEIMPTSGSGCRRKEKARKAAIQPRQPNNSQLWAA